MHKFCIKRGYLCSFPFALANELTFLKEVFYFYKNLLEKQIPFLKSWRENKMKLEKTLRQKVFYMTRLPFSKLFVFIT